MTRTRTSRRNAPYDATMSGADVPSFHDFIRSAAVSGALGSALQMFGPEDCVSPDSLDVALTRGGWAMTGDQLWSRFEAWRKEQLAKVLRLDAQIGAAS
jgi:hypothetical protein